MRLVDAFRTRHWVAATALTVIAGPFFGMLYLGRGRLAVAYGVIEAFAIVAGFAVAVAFNLIGPAVGADLGGSVYVAVVPIRIVGAVHAARLARALDGTGAWPWYARRGALIAIYVVFLVWPRLSAALIRAVWMEPVEMKTAAMAPAIVQGDRLFVDKRAYLAGEPAIGDIVLVQDQDGIAYIRRIVARRDELFTVNGEAPAERSLTLPRGAIIGKVTTIYWSATAQRWQWETPN